AQAMARAVLPQGCSTTMLVDIGGTRTGIFIMSQEIIRYTTTVGIGGHALTKLLAERFKLSIDAARKLKERSGLLQLPDTREIPYTHALSYVTAIGLAMIDHGI